MKKRYLTFIMLCVFIGFSSSGWCTDTNPWVLSTSKDYFRIYTDSTATDSIVLSMRPDEAMLCNLLAKTNSMFYVCAVSSQDDSKEPIYGWIYRDTNLKIYLLPIFKDSIDLYSYPTYNSDICYKLAYTTSVFELYKIIDYKLGWIQLQLRQDTNQRAWIPPINRYNRTAVGFNIKERELFSLFHILGIDNGKVQTDKGVMNSDSISLFDEAYFEKPLYLHVSPSYVSPIIEEVSHIYTDEYCVIDFFRDWLKIRVNNGTKVMEGWIEPIQQNYNIWTFVGVSESVIN